MKNLFLCLCGIFLLSACSENNEIVPPTNKELNSSMTAKLSVNTLSQFKQAYITMLDSKNYTNYNTASQKFTDKMKFSGYNSDLVDKSHIMAWISANLANTSFISLNDAEKDWTSIEDSFNLMKNENAFFFSELHNITDDQAQMGEAADAYLIKIYPEVFATASDDDECLRACSRTMFACHRTATLLQMTQWDAALYGSGATSGAIGAINWSVRWNQCSSNFRTCTRKC